MDKFRLVEVLGSWNFWNRDIDTGLPRKGYVGKLLNFVKTDKVVSLVGVRRSGKSTIMKQMAKALIDGHVDKNDILMVNFEELEFENADAGFLKAIYEAYLETIKPSGKPFLFLDEIQHVEKWEKFVRSLNEKKEAFIIVSGSSSKLLSNELATVLTGRQLYFETFPLSFGEVLDFEKIEAGDSKSTALNARKIKMAFSDYLEFGGFPEINLNKDREFRMRTLRSYYEDIINRDVAQRFKVKKADKLKTLARFYLTNISCLISFNRTSKFLHLPTETVRRFSYYLETSKLVFFINRFSFSSKEQENSPRKVYSIDVGLSNAVGLRFSENFGKLAENIVAVELKRRQEERAGKNLEIYYWKDNYEVDFVVKENLKVRDAIQVCWDVSNPETRERETRALLKAMKKFKLKEGLVLTEDFEGEENLKERVIKFMPLWRWLITKNGDSKQ